MESYKKTWLKSLSALFFAATLALAGCGTTSDVGKQSSEPTATQDATDDTATPTGERIKVATAIYAIEWLTTEIGKDKVEVVNIVPPGVSPHDYDPSPQDVNTVATANVVINLDNMSPQMDAIIESNRGDGKGVLDLTDVVELVDTNEAMAHEHPELPPANAPDVAGAKDDHADHDDKDDHDEHDHGDKDDHDDHGHDDHGDKDGHDDHDHGKADHDDHGDKDDHDGHDHDDKDDRDDHGDDDHAGHDHGDDDHNHGDKDDHGGHDHGDKDDHDDHGHGDHGGHDHGHHDHDHGGVDPHFWQDPIRMAVVAQGIANFLSTVDPANKDFYQENQIAVAKKLDKVDNDITTAFKSCDSKVMLVAHEAYGYYALRYEIEQYGLHGFNPFEEQGLSHYAALEKLVKEKGISTVFAEVGASPKEVEAFAKDNKLTVASLNPMEIVVSDSDELPDYIEILKTNTANIAKANNCK